MKEETLPILNRKLVNTKRYPTKVIQFGDGVFLRAFINWIIHQLNRTIDFNAGITVIKARPGRGKIPTLNVQEGLFTLYLKGIKNGEIHNEKTVIDCINKGINPYEDFSGYIAEAANPELQFLVSNTTEAGIAFNPSDKLTDKPPVSFPAKVTVFLYQRFQLFNGDQTKGLILIPCELIDKNGTLLKELVLKYATIWQLESAFVDWIHTVNIFCNTLVDRIVSGHPKARIEVLQAELGYRDSLLVEGEIYHLLVIEANAIVQEKFPADKAGLNVIFTDNLQLYKTRKVRILNGAHTSLVPVGYLYGHEYVREAVEDRVVGQYLKQTIFEEIGPTLDLPKTDVEQYANDVLDRFKNPFIKHALMSISLNSISKYKARILPTLLDYIQLKKALPKRLVFALAALIIFYKGERNGKPISLKDDPNVLEFFKKQWRTQNIPTIAKATLENTNFLGMDLSKINGLEPMLIGYLQTIEEKGMKATLNELVI